MNQQELKNIVEDSVLQIEFIQDSGHGWLKIPKELRFNLDYSNYSYSDDKFLFLEEDRDANMWMNEIRKIGIKTEYKEIIYNHECYIRNLMRLKNID